MITTLVQFQLPSPISLAEATRRFESSAPKYQNLQGLIRKYYIRSEDGRVAGGIYLWETRADAERVYNGEWRERVEKLYGAKPVDHLVRQPGGRRQSGRRIDHQGGVTTAASSKAENMQNDNTTSRGPMMAAAAGSAALAQPSGGRAKGPLVWLDMDQQALDDAYDQQVYAPNRDQVGKRRHCQQRQGARHHRRAGARRLRSDRDREGRHLSHARCPTRRSTSSSTAAPGAPTAPPTTPSWRSRSSMPARTTSCSTSSMSTTRAAACFRWSSRCGARSAGSTATPRSFGGDPDRIYLSSHSSGSHLCGCVLTHDWRKERLPVDIVKGAVLGSGMYDLKPVRLSKRSKYVNFTDEMEQALSAQRHLDKLHAPVVIAYGTYETPEFQRQSRDFVAAVKAAGKPAELLVGEGYNHFEMLETLANPYGLLGRAAFAQMGLKTGA